MLTRGLRSQVARSFSTGGVPRKVLITGPPGGGKGTMSKKLVEDFGFAHLSSGDMLRSQIQQGSDLGMEAKAFMESGDLVPDKLLVDVILASLEQTDGNFLLDGFPRNLDQAKVLDEHHDIDVVLRVDVPHAEIIERLSGRWVHAPSGRTYHTVYSPPKVAGKDDETGEDLIQRADDAPETVLNRLVTFDAMMQPIVDHYTAKGVLQVFTGTESDVIYPEMQKYLHNLWN